MELLSIFCADYTPSVVCLTSLLFIFVELLGYVPQENLWQ